MFLPRVVESQRSVIAQAEKIVSHASTPQLFVTLNLQDDVLEFKRSYPFHPLTRDTNFLLYPLLLEPHDQPLVWPAALSRRVHEIWLEGGDIWIRKYLLEATPRREVYWAEGSHPTVRWNDVQDSLLRFELGDTANTEFVTLKRSEKNIQLLYNWSFSALN
jgi:hypothetical protein